MWSVHEGVYEGGRRPVSCRRAAARACGEDAGVYDRFSEDQVQREDSSAGVKAGVLMVMSCLERS